MDDLNLFKTKKITQTLPVFTFIRPAHWKPRRTYQTPKNKRGMGKKK